VAQVRDLHRRTDLNGDERRRTCADATKDETTNLVVRRRDRRAWRRGYRVRRCGTRFRNGSSV